MKFDFPEVRKLYTQKKLDDVTEENIVIYDIETDHQFAPYATLRMIGCQFGVEGTPFVVETAADHKWFKKQMADPRVLKFGWNNRSFDDIVLGRSGYPVNEANAHDLMLAMKCIHPRSASYSLKYCSFDQFGDPHFPEMKLEAWAKKTGADKWSAPDELLRPYCLHDVLQTCNLLRLIWDHVIEEKHWMPYLLDVSQGAPVQQMMLEGGIHLPPPEELRARIEELMLERAGWNQRAFQLSKGQVINANSSTQVGAWLDSQGFDVALSAEGDFSVPKSLLLDLLNLDDPDQDQDDVVRCTYEVRRVNASLKYYENYLEAMGDATYAAARPNWIPMQFSISNARTRRYTSNSMYGLNFQNPNKEAKKVQVVPSGYLGVWFDSTQVENVVHIYESQDRARRTAYEADDNWNEYVWLCNKILGGEPRTKQQLDAIPSPQMPQWSIYKQWKTIKLALNFGMGIDKFSRTSGINRRTAEQLFSTIHEACPAIRSLQHKVGKEIATKGYVADVFGHIYSGPAREAYKVVAYLIQGTGTGSLPKAQIRANYITLKACSRKAEFAHSCGTTHDEQGFRLSLKYFDKDDIVAILQLLNHNMTERFSPLFGGIPLRAKLYLSRTTADEAKEVAITDTQAIKSFCI